MENGVKFKETENGLVAALSGEIDHHAAKGEREEIDRMLFLKKPSRLILDFSEVGFMDSSGIGLVIGRAEVASEIGASLSIVGLSPSQKKLVRLSGIEKIKGLTIE